MIDFSLNPLDDDKLKEECGVFGIIGHRDAAAHAALGLHALQHRGQEAAGIITTDGNQFYTHKVTGHVGDNFNSSAVLNRLPGEMAIGHVRYSTTGGSEIKNIQPFFAELAIGGLAIAHNGNLTNTQKLKKGLIGRGSIFQSTADTEVIIHLIAVNEKPTLIERIIESLDKVEGAYSLIFMTKDSLIGVRDPNGIRPLALGKLGDSYLLASETVAFDIIGATYMREVEPGEIVIIKDGQIESIKPFKQANHAFCIFEYVYFARPDSIVEGKHVYSVRKSIGAELAKEAHVEADIVVPVPDSGVPSAIGYATASGIPFELGIIRNHYVGRTFIEPTDTVRHLGVKLKHNANRSSIEGKDIILVDDSIVRGTTSKKIVNMLREAGARKIHMRISSPPTAFPCFYGIDTPDKDKLIAANNSIEEMAKFIGVDSLAFISIDGLYRAMGELRRNNEIPQYCDACFSGDYQVRLTDKEEE